MTIPFEKTLLLREIIISIIWVLIPKMYQEQLPVAWGRSYPKAEIIEMWQMFNYGYFKHCRSQ